MAIGTSLPAIGADVPAPQELSASQPEADQHVGTREYALDARVVRALKIIERNLASRRKLNLLRRRWEFLSASSSAFSSRK
ncbi:hypothetical protein ACOJBM_35505 [Rhizobium beringeri]